MNIIKRCYNFYKKYKVHRTSNKYVDYLRKNGVKVGENVKIFSPKNIQIDITRPELLEIGDNVFLHRGMVILTHDWTSWCFVNSHHSFFPSHGKVIIGNNVWFGENVTICKGVSIGDNCIIGIGSIVTKSIPSNSVAVGVPAKVICSYDDYYKKRKAEYCNEAVEYAKEIIMKGREPLPEDFSDDYPCFVDGENYMEYNYPYRKVFNEKQFEQWKLNHKKTFDGFKSFIDYVKKEMNK